MGGDGAAERKKKEARPTPSSSESKRNGRSRAYQRQSERKENQKWMAGEGAEQIKSFWGSLSGWGEKEKTKSKWGVLPKRGKKSSLVRGRVPTPLGKREATEHSKGRGGLLGKYETFCLTKGQRRSEKALNLSEVLSGHHRHGLTPGGVCMPLAPGPGKRRGFV